MRGVGAADALGVVRQVLLGLGDRASVTGGVLGQALTQSGFALPVEAAEVHGTVRSITKDEDRVAVDFGAQVERTLRGKLPVQLGPAITCVVQDVSDVIVLGDITGLAVKKFTWIDIQKAAFREVEGRRTVRVIQVLGGRNLCCRRNGEDRWYLGLHRGPQRQRPFQSG
jgi:hypothetical protein